MMKSKRNWSSLPCFYCSADSTELKTFLIVTIGGLAACSVFTCVGLWLRGYFKDPEHLSDTPLRAEEKEGGEY